LYDAWNACSGNWSSSRFLQNIRERHSHRKKGTRKWLFATEMDQMFGVPVATLMRTRKLENAELRAKETRNHPELPEAEDRT